MNAMTSFSFSLWREYYREQEKANIFNDYDTMKDAYVYYNEHHWSDSFISDLTESDLCRYFTLSAWDLSSPFSIWHSRQKLAHLEFIKNSYWERIQKYNITFGMSKYKRWPFIGTAMWSSKDFHEFIGNIPKMHRWFNISYQIGIVPAIVLLGIRRRKESSKTLLHSQPIDVIRIIARMTANSGWDFYLKGNPKLSFSL